MSPIRSILLHADANTPWEERLRYGADVARLFDAELTTLYAPNTAWGDHPIATVRSPDAWKVLRGADEHRLREARRAYDAATHGLDGSLRWAESDSLSPELAVIRRAFAADLLILGQRQPDAPVEGAVSRHLVESVIIDSGRPALVVPREGATAKAEVILVAWKQTRESARALSAAIPFLQRARRVCLATWTETDDAAPDCAEVVGYLRRHGIEAVPQDCGRAAPARLGESMLALATELSADLIVMGCYGHGRAHERVFGGATRAVLDTMNLPVLMAH